MAAAVDAGSGASGLRISPAPTEEETAAIVAALEAARPTVVIVPAQPEPRRSTSWRFSGRWWSKPLAARRDRPFR